ncbi:hypothetical protein [Trichlorobacter ammonificans]|uniref:Uncharacterized protein n=1 Tax=Trichlorobacter ammonificans TaxID=2916410 RepID=A0ABM9D6Q4_9BACT|nr:hypothetical protein [Trichlorobacter ammonificans]CAH2030909.1 conserved exported protein of unknown function [Trichlorobacter ammonificans]
MPQCRSFAIAAALCMLATLLHLTLPGLLQDGMKAATSGHELTQTITVGSEEEQQFPELQNFKPPKQSFVDYTTFLLSGSPLPAYGPQVVRNGGRKTSLALSDVYRDIFIPPDIVA